MRIDYKRVFLSRANSGQQEEIKQQKKKKQKTKTEMSVFVRGKQAEKKKACFKMFLHQYSDTLKTEKYLYTFYLLSSL